jgi:hypothetical protein
MPRNGLGVMSWPPNTNGVPNTTVSSTRYTAFLADLLADLNAVRPITSAGTGGTSAVSGNDGLNTTSSDIASAATLNLANATGVVITVTGATGITALGTVSSGAIRTLIFCRCAHADPLCDEPHFARGCEHHDRCRGCGDVSVEG